MQETYYRVERGFEGIIRWACLLFSTFPEHHSRGGQCDSSSDHVQWGKKLNFLKIGRVGWMGQKKGSFTPRSGVKTRSGGAWFVQSDVFRGLVDLSGERLVAREEG